MFIWEEKSPGPRSDPVRIAAGTGSVAGPGEFSVEKSEVAAALRWQRDNVNTCLLCSREGAHWAEDKM